MNAALSLDPVLAWFRHQLGWRWVNNFSCFAQTLHGKLLTGSTALPSTAWLLT